MHEDDCDPLPLTESRTCLKHPGPLSTHPVSSVLKREPMTRTSFGTASILWTLAILLRHSKLCTAMRECGCGCGCGIRKRMRKCRKRLIVYCVCSWFVRRCVLAEWESVTLMPRRSVVRSQFLPYFFCYIQRTMKVDSLSVTE
jgi:hypothetical protein